jgi:hypothetical protein
MQPQRCNWINQIGMQCGQPLGHMNEHGNGLLTTPRDTWHEFTGESPLQFKVEEPFGVVWTDKSTKKRCMWSGMHSRCVYELGHTIKHREENQ